VLPDLPTAAELILTGVVRARGKQSLAARTTGALGTPRSQAARGRSGRKKKSWGPPGGVDPDRR